MIYKYSLASTPSSLKDKPPKQSAEKLQHTSSETIEKKERKIRQ